MRVERVRADPCGLARRWLLAPGLAVALVALEKWASQRISTARVDWPGLFIISGHRSAPVVGAFAPDAPAAAQSLHIQCPSLAVDLRVGNAPASFTPIELWTALGLQWERQGGRWGGRFEPPDPNHFDLGQGFDPSRTSVRTVPVQRGFDQGPGTGIQGPTVTFPGPQNPLLPVCPFFPALSRVPCRFNPADPHNFR